LRTFLFPFRRELDGRAAAQEGSAKKNPNEINEAIRLLGENA
jgi:hypothetical protein